MPLNLKKKIGDARVVLLILPRRTYTQEMLKISKQLGKEYRRFCYVSLNRPWEDLRKALEADEVDTSKFFFIDCISKETRRAPEKITGCEFLSGPSALTEMNISISNNIEAKKCDALLFDSLSTLLVYNKDTVVVRFTHDLIERVTAVGCTAFFTIIEGDEEGSMMKNIYMFLDRVVPARG